MARTPEEVLEQGLDALRERLGRADMIRFIQHFDSGKGDYAKERHKLVDRLTMADIEAALAQYRKDKQDRKRKK